MFKELKITILYSDQTIKRKEKKNRKEKDEESSDFFSSSLTCTLE